MNRIKPYAKAVLAFIAPGAVVIGSAVTEASDGGTAITGAESSALAITLPVAAPAPARPRAPATSRLLASFTSRISLVLSDSWRVAYGVSFVNVTSRTLR